MACKALSPKILAAALACGVLTSLATGLAENPPEASIIGFKYYGYPLVWRVTRTLEPAEYRYSSLAVDAAFWVMFSLLALFIARRIVSSSWKVSPGPRNFLLPLVLFIPLGLVMDFVHELGHAVWGAVVGGRLVYMQIGYFEIYPRLAITPQFQLGWVQVQGLTTEFAYGLFLLGGSLTTNIVAWLLALFLLKTRLGHRTQVVLKVSGIFCLLDLPFYVIFPEIGLQHWILLGGRTAEPLIGARRMGMSDPAFCAMTVLTSIGLISVYFRPSSMKGHE